MSKQTLTHPNFTILMYKIEELATQYEIENIQACINSLILNSAWLRNHRKQHAVEVDLLKSIEPSESPLAQPAPSGDDHIDVV